MLKIIKYSKENILQYFSMLTKKVYLIFYDLESENFNFVLSRISKSLNNIDTEIIKYHNYDCLMVFGYLNYEMIHLFVDELDSLDIGEFELSEYQEKQNAINTIISSKRDNKLFKTIYVNKDEKIIQLYNIY